MGYHLCMSELYYPFPVSLVSEWPDSPGRPEHTGTDFAVPSGSGAKASFSGVVRYVGGDGLGGMTIDIVRPDGLLARYGHLSKYLVSKGATVQASQIIGITGNTGMSEGPHLHWELRTDTAWNGGQWKDPRKLGAVEFPKNPPKPKPEPETKKKRNKNMLYLILPMPKGEDARAVFTPGLLGSWCEFPLKDLRGQAANAFHSQLGDPVIVSLEKWQQLQTQYHPKNLGKI
jgi:hypothetical protein